MNNQMNNNQINQSVTSGINSSQAGIANKKPANATKQTKAANSSKYTENWLPLKAISNGIMYNNKNEMITGVKIQPRNIFIMDNQSQNIMIYNLINFYNTLDYEFWLIIALKLSSVLSKLRSALVVSELYSFFHK